jgi:alanyl-tRNA synthetase
MNSQALREAFTKYFVDRGHVSVPSASLIPHDTTVLFTVAGMVPFKPYFLGEEVPPYTRATSIQKCMRAGGKHNDLDQIGHTLRHLTFFEMLGNFSFGDYFKEEAIPLAWGLVTEVLGLDPERLWVTVHVSDDEAEALWKSIPGVPHDRIQRLDDDNWWQMADTGPCGPCSEIFYDKGPEFGEDGGPAFGGDDRFLEIWNLVFMQYDRDGAGELHPLPKPCIDTGAGLERIVPLLQGRDSVYETDLMMPILETASAVTQTRYGAAHDSDVALRIMADHARSMSFLVADGVFPTNEGRGYVLRRMIRRCVLRGYMLGATDPFGTRLVESVVETMGAQYPELTTQADYIASVVEREEGAFRERLKVGLGIFESHVSDAAISGDVAFRLHDTFGFPIELTKEIAEERNVAVDLEGFAREMANARELSRSAGLGGAKVSPRQPRYLEILDEHGQTTFTGYDRVEDEGRLLALLDAEEGTKELFFDRTPFYAEGGGQVGDVGMVIGQAFKAKVIDTKAVLPGLYCHVVTDLEGAPVVGSLVRLGVDRIARDGSRRNHTGTHLLHWALRSVLGSHVKQQGSLVAPDRLRFDFTHFSPLTEEERNRVEDLVNHEILSDTDVVVEEMDREEALSSGAIAFFGDRYGDVVRVVKAGSSSVELCGGTHVHRLGMVGPLKIVSEASIGANTRRIEALTGEAALKYIQEEEALLSNLAAQLRATPEELPKKLEALRAHERSLSEELAKLRSHLLSLLAKELVASNTGAYVVARVDGRTPDELRELALMVRGSARVVVLGGSPDGERASLVAATSDPSQVASELLRDAAAAIGGGVGRQQDLAMTGGRHVGAIDEALAIVRRALGGEA